MSKNGKSGWELLSPDEVVVANEPLPQVICLPDRSGEPINLNERRRSAAFKLYRSILEQYEGRISKLIEKQLMHCMRRFKIDTDDDEKSDMVMGAISGILLDNAAAMVISAGRSQQLFLEYAAASFREAHRIINDEDEDEEET